MIVLTPHAPIGFNKDQPKGGPRAWYYQIEDDMVRLDLLGYSLQALDFLIQDIKSGKELGVKPRTLCLAGFSQGGTISVSYPLVYPGKIDYAGNFAGYIPRNLPVNANVNPKLYGRLLWGHGTEDYCNDYYLAEWGFPQLEVLGVDFIHMHDPVGHTVLPRWFNEMLVQWLHSPKKNDSI
jgi:predicted esterase